jgi:hypothetical protein
MIKQLKKDYREIFFNVSKNHKYFFKWRNIILSFDKNLFNNGTLSLVFMLI